MPVMLISDDCDALVMTLLSASDHQAADDHEEAKSREEHNQENHPCLHPRLAHVATTLVALTINISRAVASIANIIVVISRRAVIIIVVAVIVVCVGFRITTSLS